MLQSQYLIPTRPLSLHYHNPFLVESSMMRFMLSAHYGSVLGTFSCPWGTDQEQTPYMALPTGKAKAQLITVM